MMGRVTSGVMEASAHSAGSLQRGVEVGACG